MALKQNINLYGITIQNAYIKIGFLQGDKNLINVRVDKYTEDKSTKINITEEWHEFVPSVEDTATNFIKQGYEYLKTLDEYAEATDILD